jgi:hypothetical protein
LGRRRDFPRCDASVGAARLPHPRLLHAGRSLVLRQMPGVVPAARASAAPIYCRWIWLPIEVPQHLSPQTAPELLAPSLSSPSPAVKAASHRGRAISGPLPTLMAPRTRSGGPSRWKCPMVGQARLLSKASRAEREASPWHCWVRTWLPSDPARIGHAVP